MEISDVFVRAMKAVEEAKVPVQFQEAAFLKAVDLISGVSSHSVGTAAPGSAATAAPSSAAAAPQAADAPATAKIAAKTGLGEAAVQEVFASDPDEGLQVIAGVGKLDPSDAGGTKQLALLVAGGRQLGDLEEWTDTKRIRNVVQQYGRFDQGNFAKTVAKMDDVFGFKGKGQSRSVKLNRSGIEEFKKLVTKLAGM